MNKIIIVLCLSIIYPLDITNDSLAVLIVEGKNEILEEVKYFDPLIDKRGGIEINPLYTLLYSEDGLSFSGTISIFPKNKNIEIAIPLAYKSDALDALQAKFRMDIQYRYFLGKHRKGIYIMSGFRHATFDDEDLWLDSQEKGYNRQGITFGVGYRIFAKNGIYWGASFYAGKYISGEERIDNDQFMNIEFFKFGHTF